MFCLIVHYWENIFHFNYYYHFLKKEVGRRHLCIFKDYIELDINSQLTLLSILLIHIICFFSLYIFSIFFITAGYDCVFPFLSFSLLIFLEDIFTQKKNFFEPIFFSLGSGSNNTSFYSILSLFLLSELFLLVVQ